MVECLKTSFQGHIYFPKLNSCNGPKMVHFSISSNLITLTLLMCLTAINNICTTIQKFGVIIIIILCL